MHHKTSLYIHWPFCLSKCPYCDFNSHVRNKIDEDLWEKSFLKSLSYEKNRFPDLEITSIFFGGGTPSLMPPRMVELILKKIDEYWNLPCEVTLEANPTSIEFGKFKDFRQAGITRVSIGIQSLIDKDLKMLGREHSATEAKIALNVASTIFDNWSFDLIYARPHQKIEDWENELKEALSMGSKHLSLYQLTIEKGTAFYTLYQRGELKLPDEETQIRLWESTNEITKAHGFGHYEISNYALSGFESRHNLNYWRYGSFLGLGPGAHGRIMLDGKNVATTQFKAPETWLKNIENFGHGYELEDSLDTKSQMEEKLLMGIRLEEGLDISSYNFNNLAPLIEHDLIHLDGNILKLTRQGRLKTNAVSDYLLAK